MKYEFYPDIFWVTNFVMDTLVLLLVRQMKKSGSPIYRIPVSSAFGATASVFLFLNFRNYTAYQLLIHLTVNPVMIAIAFSKNVRERVLSSGGACPASAESAWRSHWGIRKPAVLSPLLRDFLSAYLMMLLLGGILSWGTQTLGQLKYFWIWALGGFGICMLVIHRLESRKLEHRNYEILLLLENRNLMLTGFLDTGNMLVDPIFHQPVHIIQEELLEEELKKEQLSIRYIPYHSLGQENGLLPVVTLRAMYIKEIGEREGKPPVYLEKPVFGLTKEKLFQGKNYQVILNAGAISV